MANISHEIRRAVSERFKKAWVNEGYKSIAEFHKAVNNCGKPHGFSISLTAFGDNLRGKTTPMLETLYFISEALPNTSMHWLITGSYSKQGEEYDSLLTQIEELDHEIKGSPRILPDKSRKKIREFVSKEIADKFLAIVDQIESDLRKKQLR